jgi:nitroreductase
MPLEEAITTWFPPFVVASYYGSIFPAVQNLLLAARALPLWSTWRARRILGLPFSVMPCAVVPLGWPIGKYGPTTRGPVEDVVSIDRWGNRAWKT